MDRFIDVSVVARRFGVSTTAVRNWIRAGKLSAVRTPSGRYRIPLSALAFIKAKESKAS